MKIDQKLVENYEEEQLKRAILDKMRSYEAGRMPNERFVPWRVHLIKNKDKILNELADKYRIGEKVVNKVKKVLI